MAVLGQDGRTYADPESAKAAADAQYAKMVAEHKSSPQWALDRGRERRGATANDTSSLMRQDQEIQRLEREAAREAAAAVVFTTPGRFGTRCARRAR